MRVCLVLLFSTCLTSCTPEKCKTLETCTEQCEDDVPFACFRMGVAHTYGRFDLEKDDAAAVRYFEKACDLDFATACHDAGAYYAVGSGVPLNPLRARQLYDRGCELGGILGCTAAGLSYRKVEPKNAYTARKRFARGCELGDAGACDLSKAWKPD